jgi:hypothetical protein
MRVNYFDLGLYRAVELEWMVNQILPALGIEDYRAYGIEASHPYATAVDARYTDNPRVQIDHLAIAGEETTLRLYHSPNLLGHSIYSTKNNVLQDKYEDVQAMRFSEWIKKNDIDLEGSYNIMKVNIEGAEWPLFQDMVENDLVKHIDIFCGADGDHEGRHDIEKVGELKPIADDYYSLLKEHDIEIHRFTEWKPRLNRDITRMIFDTYATKAHTEVRQISEIKDTDVPSNYRQVWEDVSKPTQLKKATNHQLSPEETQSALAELVVRPTYLCEIAKLYGAKTIAEVGTAQGLQSYTFAEYLKSEGIPGHVWTCDIVNVRNTEYEEKYADVMTFCDGNSKKMAEVIASQNQTIDLFYIDGAHDRGDVIRDVFHLKGVQSDNPVWIFDDYDSRFGCYHDITAIMKIAKKFKVYSVGQTASGNPNHQVVVYGKL